MQWNVRALLRPDIEMGAIRARQSIFRVGPDVSQA
jgi:hypothetical protein